MLLAFGDESHDSTKERIFAVAALLGDETQWASFGEKWNARLGGLIFHAADCESGYGDFRGTPEMDRHPDPSLNVKAPTTKGILVDD